MKMMINRNNYETFFLLYIDNELSVTEKKMVEEFVQQHTDLAEELNQLKAVVLPQDDISFENKADLLKSQAHDDLLQEKLLMHLDAELDKEAAAAITALIQKDAALKSDWQILQQTKLDAGEKFIFQHKDLLYRKERDNVVIGRFVRWAIAAAILGAGFFIGISISNKKNIDGAVADAGKPKTGKSVNTNFAKNTLKTIADTSQTLPAQNKVNDNFTAQQTKKESDNKKEQLLKEKEEQQQNLAANKEKQPKNILPVQQSNNVNKPEDKILLANNTIQHSIEKQIPERNNALIAAAPNIKPTASNTLTDTDITILDNSMARTAGLTSATDQTNNDRILYMKEETLSRSKAGVFFRKLKRVVERNTQIKTDKGLRIGGFELALK